jgi:hypothetical protein
MPYKFVVVQKIQYWLRQYDVVTGSGKVCSGEVNPLQTYYKDVIT